MTPTPAITDIVGEVSTVVTESVSWMGEFATAISQHTILILGVVAVPLVGLGVGLLSRLLRKRV